MFVLIAGLLFIVGCSDSDDLVVHENVDKNLATDSMQVLEIIEESVHKQTHPNEADKKTLEAYVDKYGFQQEDSSLEGVNNDIYRFIETSIKTLDRNITLESGKQTVDDLRVVITSYIENGDTGTNTYSEDTSQ